MRALAAQKQVVVARRILLSLSVFVLVAFVLLALVSLRCYMLEGDEANVLSVAAVSLHRPMYLAPGSLDASYALMYGPVTFLIDRAGLVAGGANHFWVLRCMIVLADFGVVLGLYALLRRFVSRTAAVAVLCLPLSVLLQHVESSMAIRSDLWIVLFTTLAILCSYLEVEWLAVVLTGIFCGLIPDLKISAVPAALFPLLIIYWRFGFRKQVICAAIALAALLAPFALPGVSLQSYAAWIRFTRTEGISPAHLALNLAFALFLLAPCLVMRHFARTSTECTKERRSAFLLIVLCLGLAVLTSKPGSGPWYLWHIVPSIVVYLAMTARSFANLPQEEKIKPLFIIAVACSLMAIVNLPRAYAVLSMSRLSPGIRQAHIALLRNLDLYKGRSVQMGYGSVGDDLSTSLRYIPVYQGQPYTLEGNTGRFETLLLPFPSHVLDRMTNCTDDVWLIPHAQQPFAIYLFPEILRQTFQANYSIARSDGIYDAWVCRRAGPR